MQIRIRPGHWYVPTPEAVMAGALVALVIIVLQGFPPRAVLGDGAPSVRCAAALDLRRTVVDHLIGTAHGEEEGVWLTISQQEIAHYCRGIP